MGWGPVATSSIFLIFALFSYASEREEGAIVPPHAQIPNGGIRKEMIHLVTDYPYAPARILCPIANDRDTSTEIGYRILKPPFKRRVGLWG